jgi:hypothetical protein
MRKSIGISLIALIVSVAAFSIPAPQPKVYDHMDVDVLIEQDETVSLSTELWKTEVARRFPNAHVIICHGNDDQDGVWCLYPKGTESLNDVHRVPVAKLAQKLRDAEPGRPIVFLTCNPWHHVINIPGVYHARSNVWFITDKQMPKFIPQLLAVTLDQEAVGNIFEFTDDTPEVGGKTNILYN